MARQKALMQEARVKRVWAILHFFTQFGFIVFTYLINSVSLLTRQNKFDQLLVQNGVNKPTILNPPKAYTVFILTFDF
jgi:hypothetical protein